MHMRALYVYTNNLCTWRFAFLNCVHTYSIHVSRQRRKRYLWTQIFFIIMRRKIDIRFLKYLDIHGRAFKINIYLFSLKRPSGFTGS